MGYTLPGLMASEIGNGSGLGGGANLVTPKHLGSGDPIRALLAHQSRSEVMADNRRCVIDVEHVTQDIDGLYQLIVSYSFFLSYSIYVSSNVILKSYSV